MRIERRRVGQVPARGNKMRSRVDSALSKKEEDEGNGSSPGTPQEREDAVYDIVERRRSILLKLR